MKLIVLTLLSLCALAFAREPPFEVREIARSVVRDVYDVKLADVVGQPEDEDLNQVGDDLKEGFLRILEETLGDVYQRIKNVVDEKKEVFQLIRAKIQELRTKVAELKEKYGQYHKKIVELVRAKIQEILEKIVELQESGKRSFTQLMDYVARLKWSDIIRHLKEKLLSDETLSKVRTYFRNLVSESKVIKSIKELLERVPLHRVRELLDSFLSHTFGRQSRSLAEFWEKVREFFKDVKVKLEGHYFKLYEFLMEHWNKAKDKLREKGQVLKDLAQEVIDHAKDLSQETAQEALEFFAQYKEQLGGLYEEMKEKLKDIVGELRQGKE